MHKLLPFSGFLMLAFFSVLVPLENLQGQSEHPNLVPNPGFEQFASPPIGWFYKGEHFTRVMKYWSSPTGASPDAFGPGVRVPAHWAEKGFGQKKPHGGLAMAGITVYGCGEGKPHCREYLQIQLLEPLVVGQEYEVQFWLSPLPRSLQVNNVGAHFAKEEKWTKTDPLLSLPPQMKAEKPVRVREEDAWTYISGRFTAQEEANYLLIGNFFADSLTQTYAPCEDPLPFAYYYIDDVSVRKQEPILPVPVPEDDLSRVEISPGKVIRLKNIFFQTDQAELLPRSFVELNKLLQLMQSNKNLVIQINGHTDNRGDHPYNQDLSERRARAVVDFLVGNGIDAGRLQSRGFGSTQPVSSNQSDSGRQLNRRVEFVVLKM